MGTSRLSRRPTHARCAASLIALALAVCAFALVWTDSVQAQAPTRPATVAPPTSTPTPPPDGTPEPTASDSAATAEATAEVTVEAICPGAPVTRLVQGERGRVSIDDPRPLNIRSGPGTSNEIVGQIPARGIFFVIEGPQCSQRYAWYRVSYREGDSDDAVITGWIAEGDENAYFVEVYPPGW